MLIASVLDPGLFTQDCRRDPTIRALLVDHLMHVAHCHIMICDQDNLLGKAIVKGLASLPPCIAQQLSVAFIGDAARIVRLAIPAQDTQSILDILPDLPLTATAMALSNQPGVDATLASQDGYEAIHMTELPHDRVFSLSSYADSNVKRREYDSMGSVSTKDMPQREFCDNIINPFVRWANKVIMIDKIVATSFFDHTPGDQGSNWPIFSRTIKCIYQAWKEECKVEPDSFEIITCPNQMRNWEKPHQSHWLAEGVQHDYTKQARLIGETLMRDGLTGELRVRLIKTNNLRAVAHDRYLVNNRSAILNFSRGFDLIHTPQGILTETAVSLYREREQGSVSRILTAGDAAVWESPALLLAKQKEANSAVTTDNVL